MAKPKTPRRNSDDNTERPLIALIEKILVKFTQEIRDALEALTAKNEKIMTALGELIAAQDAATIAQTDLTTAVNAAIIRLGTPGATDAQLLSVATAIKANTTSDKSLTEALNAALGATPPIDPPIDPPVDPIP